MVPIHSWAVSYTHLHDLHEVAEGPGGGGVFDKVIREAAPVFMRFEGIEIAVGHGDQRAEAFGAQRRNAVIVEAVGKGDFSLGKLLRFTVYGDGISALVDDEKRDLAVEMVGAFVLLVEGEILLSLIHI